MNSANLAGSDWAPVRTKSGRAACLLEVTGLESSFDKATRKIKTDNIKTDDTKAKAKILKQNLEKIAKKKELN